MSKSRGSYKPVSPERVNPEFLGIGEKYSRHKRRRVESDQQRKNVESNFHYMIKLNEEMDRNIEDKNKELIRLQKIRERHNNDVRQVHIDEIRK